MRTIIFTGAGCSQESGLPTYRGTTGIYSHTTNGEQALSSHALRTDPESVHRILDEMRTTLASCAPNAAHVAIAEYAKTHDTLIVTQNVDDLLERAGAVNVLHLHGNVTQMRCPNGHGPQDIGYTRPPDIRCPTCNARLRVNVILFGEEAPAYRTFLAELSTHTPSDALVVVGTNGSVVPIGPLSQRLPGYKTLVNLEPTEHISTTCFDFVYFGPATTGVPLALATIPNLEPLSAPNPPRVLKKILKKLWMGQ